MSFLNVKVGTVGYVTKPALVHSSVDIVELTESREFPPGKSAAKKWRKSVPSSVLATTQLSRYLFDPLPQGAPLSGEREKYGGFQCTEENKGLWKRALDFAKGVHAEALVLMTPADLRPATTGPVVRLEEFLSCVEREALPVIWVPSGPWEHEQAMAFAQKNNLVLAVDPLRDKPSLGDFAYLRLGPFSAMGSRMGVYDLERIAETALDFKKTFCVFETPRALDDAVNLKKILNANA